MKLMKKTLAVFLVILTIFTSISVIMPVLATYDYSTSGNVTDGNVPEDEEASEEPEVQIISEITEKREENAKHFLMSDGSFMVAQYDGPVHELDNDGNWIDIDNTITEAEATVEQTELFGTDELYTTSNITDNVAFAEKSNSNTLVSYEAKDYPISLNYQSAKKSNIKIVEDKTELTGNNAFLTLPNVTQEVIYENVFTDVDLQYFVSPTQLKENIILKSKSAQNTFTVNYNIGELTAELVDGKTVNLMAGDEVIYTITAPYMTDANGEKSENITLTVDKNHNGKLRIDITADSTWLQAENRAYPVVVDPTITTETTRTAIDSVMIAEAQPNKNFSTQSEMIVGRESSEHGYCRVLAKINLPSLNKGDIIVGAQMNILNHGLWPYSDITPDMQVNAHVITEAWSVSSVTWSNQPTYNSVVSDYDIFEEMDEATWRKFDITKIAKQWYEEPDTNYGIMLKGANTTGDYAENGVKADMYTERYNEIDDAYPQILLTYRNNKGLENYWTYTSLSAGGAGAAYINDYTGNLVFAKNIISSSNELMPLSVDCVYNGYVSDTKYVTGKNGSNLTVPGCGWRLSIQQTVIPSSFYGLTGDALENYPYVYTDGDGTEHYFYKKTDDETDEVTYEDEDGLGLVLEINRNNDVVTGYVITDKKDNKLTFNIQHNLIKSEDANGNYITVNYDSTGKKLQSIVDGAGKTYTVSYITGMDYIDYITDPSDRKIDFAYSQGRLVTIVHTDGTVSNFTYDDTEYSMLTAKDNDGYQLSFEYTSAQKGKRVSSVTEYGIVVEGETETKTEGQKITFNRTKYNTTTIQSAGVDGVFDSPDDLITTYQFDNFGKTVTQQLSTKSGVDSVAGVYNYTEKDASALKTANKVTSSASLGKNIVNYVRGGNGETLTNWTAYKNSAVTSSIACSSGAAYIGQKSILVNNTAVTAAGANANVYQDISGLTAGSTYTLSAYVKTENMAAGVSSSAGAYIALRFNISEGGPEIVYSEYIAKDIETSVNKGWRRLTATVTLPSGITSVRAYLGLKNYTGKAYFDCIQLENSSVANDFNLIENSSFEKYTAGLPDNWTVSDNISFTQSGNTVYEGITSKYAKDGTKSMVIKGDADENKFLSQYAYVYGNPNDTYIVSAWAAANAVSKADNHPDARFQITIMIYYNDGNGGTYTEYKSPAKFNPTISDWQYTAQTFTLKSTEHPSYQPKAVRIVPVYYDQVNYAYFDYIQLIKDVAQSYVYDDEGNIVSVSANAEQKDDMEYEDSDLKTYTDVLGNKTTYNYDSKHNVTMATAPGGMKSEFAYNEKGQQTESYIKNSGGTLVIKSETEYTNDKAYVSKVKDADGNAVSYSYDLTTGLVTSVTNPRGYATTYSYDDWDRLEKVTSGDTSVSYSYNGNKLDKITYGDDKYKFVYDIYGNVTKNLVNDKELSTNTYGANNGVLLSTEYGNGAVRKYTYDNYGNLRTVKNANGGTMFSWAYDSSMTPLVHRDAINNLKYNYGYDAIGRLIRQQVVNNTTDAHIGSTEYTYDLRNNVIRVINEMGGRDVKQWYSHSAISGRPETVNYAKDNLSTRYYLGETKYVDYDYDSLNRLTSKTLSLLTPLETTYTYKESALGGNYTTSQIATETIGANTYSYTYDKLGNITSISLNGEEIRSFVYDRYNQLKRDNNKLANLTYYYNYDGYGNLTDKRTYDYTTGSLGAMQSRIVYGYEAGTAAGWSKLLTGFGNETITYDAIGNPLTYRGATLDWDGRQLKSYDKGNTSVTYKYDSDGLRASKTVNGEKTTYQYVSGKLMYEDRNGTDIYYYYDSYGVPTSIVYYLNGTTYGAFNIATNQQGDVIALYNANANIAVKYEYDAWGNIISETDANGNALIGRAAEWNEINPFRYRGYYWDAETGLYYLQSRYYDPVTGRFVNSDKQLNADSILGFNTFAYCYNNPVMYIDTEGNRPAVGAHGGNRETAEERHMSAAAMNPKIDVPKKQKGTIKGLLRTAVDAFSIEAGAGYGFGVSAEVGLVGLEAYIKGNPIDIVLTTNDMDRGCFYTFESAVSVDFLVFEIFYEDDAQRCEFWTGKDVSKGVEKDFRIKEEFNFSASLYFFVGGELEISYNYKSVLDYMRFM